MAGNDWLAVVRGEREADTTYKGEAMAGEQSKGATPHEAAQRTRELEAGAVLLSDEWQGAAFDFAHVNLEYLIQARDLSRLDPRAAALLMEIPQDVAHRLATVTPASLTRITAFKLPLVCPRLPPWWWERVLRAMAEGEPGELEVLLEHAGSLAGG